MTQENQSAAMTVERDIEGESLTMTAGAGALAQQAVAAVQARYVMALKRPRNMDQVRQDLLKECERPAFAVRARYRKPIGEGIEGPSIRFAEAAIRCMRNIYVETLVVSDERTKRILRVAVSDLETNATYYKDIAVEKVVERHNLRQGQIPLGKRTNSYGKQVYLVEASEDDLLNKEGALVSKAMRTCALRLIPGDLIDEAMDRVIHTLRSGAEADPDGERKNIVDAFGKLGVRAEELGAYLGHDLGASTPHELVELRAVWATLNDGAATWPELLDASPHRKGPPADPTKAPHVVELQKKVQARISSVKKAAERKASKARQPQQQEEQPPPSGAPADPENDGRD